VAQDEPRDDRSDTVQLGQRRARRGDGVSDAALGGGDVAIETTEIGQQLECESLAFDPRGPVGVDAAQQLRGPIGSETAGRAAGDELSQRHMQPTGRLGTQRDQIVVAVDQHPDHRGVVLHPHRPEPAVPQPSDGGGQRVVGIVLRSLARAQ
jgi:hypothetical protein